MSGQGRIDVQSGVAFLLTPVLELQSGGRPAEWTTRLEVIRSVEERRKLEEKAVRALEEELGLK
jgi:hypothetical protein